MYGFPNAENMRLQKSLKDKRKKRFDRSEIIIQDLIESRTNFQCER